MSQVRYRINRPDVIDEHFEDEYVVVNLRTGTYYSLNPSGAVIWDAIERGASRKEIIDLMTAQFQAVDRTPGDTISRFLDELEGEALIEPTHAQAVPEAEQEQGPASGTELAAFAPPLLEKFTDMQALLLLDPIHQVDDTGWPAKIPDAR